MNELLPCPFCGSKPSTETRDWSVTIYCSSRTCGCCVEAEGTGLDCAAEAWNRRHAQRAPMAADIAQIIDAGRRNGKSDLEIAEDVRREFDAAPTQCARNTVIEECAAILDACAQDWNRIRDPGMANNARAYAKKIRALSAVSSTVRGDAS